MCGQVFCLPFQPVKIIVFVKMCIYTAAQAGKLCMTFTSTPAEARMYIDKGFDAVANSMDTIIIGQAFKEMVKDIRG